MSAPTSPAAVLLPPTRPDQRRKLYKFDSLQAFRALAALAVVYWHVNYCAKRELGISYHGPLSGFGNNGVDFFFVLSGFIITWMHLADLGKPDRLAPYALKRLVRIYPIMWIIVLVKAAAALLAPALLKNTPVNAHTMAGSLLLFPYLFGVHNAYILPVQWSLVNEVLFYLIFAAWMVVGKRAAAATAFVWAAAILWTNGQSQNPFLVNLLSPLNLEFLAGCLVAFLVSRAFLPNRLAVALFGLAILLLGLVLALNRREPLCFASVFGLLVAAAVSMDAHWTLRWPRWLTYLGDASYSIYLVHMNVILLGLAIARKLRLPADAHGQILLHLMGVLSVVGGVLCFQFVEKPMLAFVRCRFAARQAALSK